MNQEVARAPSAESERLLLQAKVAQQEALDLNRSRKLAEIEKLNKQELTTMAQIEIVDFTDLINEFEKGNFIIPDTARRGIMLEQLDKVVAHMTRRVLGRHKWNVKRFWREGVSMVTHQIVNPTEVNLCK